jgi:hypothetical protein
MAAKKSMRRHVRAANPLDPRLLLRIWRQLDKKGREQVITAAFGMLKAQTDRTADGADLPKAMRNVLFRSNVRGPLEKAMLCGPNKYVDLEGMRKRKVGRWQVPMQWLVNGNLIAPDWRGHRRGSAPEAAA